MRRAAFLVFFITASVSVGHAQQSITLEEALESARHHSRQMQIAELEVKKSVLGVAEAKTRRLPAFSIASNESLSFVRSGITIDKGSLGSFSSTGPIPATNKTLTIARRPITITQASATEPLTQQYRLSLLVNVARLKARSTGVSALQSQLDIERDVRTGYFNLRQLESRQHALASQREALSRLVEETSNAEVLRQVLESDMLKAASQLADVRLESARLADPIATQRSQLNRLMGRETESDWETVSTDLPDDPSLASDDLVKRALAQRPDIADAGLRLNQRTLEAHAKRAERIPDISFAINSFSTVNLGGALPSDLAFAGLQVNWDVFDWGRKRAEWRQAILAEQQAGLELAETTANAVIDVDHRRRKIEEAHVAVSAAAAQLHAAQETLRVARNRYEVRDILLSDRLAAEATEASAESRLAAANLELATALAELKRAIGE